MTRRFVKLASALLGVGLFLSVGASDEAAQVKGEWSLNNWVPGEAVHLVVKKRTLTTRWEWGSDQPLGDLHGLTRDQLHAVHTSVTFTLDRDAGALAFQGALTLGVGGGEIRFVPNPTYAARLAMLGYESVGENDLLGLALRDVSLAYASEVKLSGLKDVTVSDLTRFRDHGVGLDFIHELAAAGYSNLTGADVVRLRDHGVDGVYMSALKRSGYPEVAASGIIRLHDHGVSAEYVARIRSAGYDDLSVDDIIKLHDHGVD